MKNDDFQYLFSYPFERTLPHKPLEHHQCQSLDMLCKLECERKSIILFASQQQLITAKFLPNFGMYPRLILIIPHLFCIVKFFYWKKYLHKIVQRDIIYISQLNKRTVQVPETDKKPENREAR